jgi:hypothetical protein
MKSQSPDVKLVKQTNLVTVPENKTNDLPQPVNNPYLNNNKQAIADNSNKQEVIKQKEALTNPTVTSESAAPLNIVQASFPENDENLDQPEKKNKLRGIFRKLTRTLEKRANIDATDDGNKLLVAGLSFKLK